MTIPEFLRQWDCIDLNTFVQPKTNSAPSKEPRPDFHSNSDITYNISNNNPIESEVLCKRCGRVLKDVNSKILGMGPLCYKQYRAERSRTVNLLCPKGLGKCKT